MQAFFAVISIIIHHVAEKQQHKQLMLFMLLSITTDHSRIAE